MNDLERRFRDFQAKHPLHGDVLIMSMAVEKIRYPRETIRRAFNKLVSGVEFEEDEKQEIISYLEIYSNGTRSND